MAEKENSRNCVLITGRTQAQTKGMHLGKTGDFYANAVSVAVMHPEMFKTMGVEVGCTLRLRSDSGEISVRSESDPGMPADMVFVPMGPVANRLVGPDTGGCGMPSFKGIRVEVTPE
ncbi:MAG TPA: molybdopterin dinucleotide binding domain-containing protein [Synergistales bacterium]|nr:molybdopterin dinucleotide binding domain-containing protein [Synergistales bacterium]HRV71041.1 molybdopterin dinucleotide binding domain-containing protein [Thermovirgaceae bacterium]